MQPRFTLLPPPWSPAGRALADLRRVAVYAFAIVSVFVGVLLTLTGYVLGGFGTLCAVLVFLAAAGVFIGLCLAVAVPVWGVLVLAGRIRNLARLLASWAAA